MPGTAPLRTARIAGGLTVGDLIDRAASFGEVAGAQVVLEHRGTGYIGELVDARLGQVGDATYLVLLGEEPTARQMPTLDDWSPRFTFDDDELPRGLPKEWVAVRDWEQDTVIAYTHPERFEQTWQAVVAEERRYLR